MWYFGGVDLGDEFRVGSWLEQLRVNIGKSRRQVGEDGGVNHRTVERIETGYYGDPRWSTIERVLKGIGVESIDVTYKVSDGRGHVQPTLDDLD